MKLFSVKDVWQCQNYATAIFLPVEAFRGTHKTRLIRMLPIFQILTKKKTAIVQVFGLPVIISSFPIFCHHSHLSVSPFFIVMGSWFLSKFLKEREMQIFLLGRMTGLFPPKERRRAQLPRIFWYFFSFFKSIYWEMSYRIFTSLSEFEGWANFRQQKTCCFGIINRLFSDNRKALPRKSSILYPFERWRFLVVLSI